MDGMTAYYALKGMKTRIKRLLKVLKEVKGCNHNNREEGEPALCPQCLELIDRELMEDFEVHDC